MLVSKNERAHCLLCNSSRLNSHPREWPLDARESRSKVSRQSAGIRHADLINAGARRFRAAARLANYVIVDRQAHLHVHIIRVHKP
jgi:hypothetical protein